MSHLEPGGLWRWSDYCMGRVTYMCRVSVNLLQQICCDLFLGSLCSSRSKASYSWLCGF